MTFTPQSGKTISFDITSVLALIALCIEGHTEEMLCLVAAAALHEFGHLIAARLLKIKIASLHISILGAQLSPADPLIPYQREWILCACGPAFSFMGTLLCLPFCRDAYEPIGLFAVISAGLGFINILPIGQLDGGRMFRVLCMNLFPPITAFRILQTVSFFFLILLWLLSLYLLLRIGESISLFVFCLSLFIRFFLSGKSE